MSTKQLQQIKNQLASLDFPTLQTLQKFIAKLMSKKTITKKSSPNLDKIPERDATTEEAKIIDEYRKNPQLLSAEETKNFLQSLKMKL